MLKHFFLLTTVVLFVFLSIKPAQTQSIANTTTNPDSALQAIVDSLQGTPLPLHLAVQEALDNATSVRTAQAAYMAAEGARRREAGYFDPELFFNMNYSDRKEATASFFSGAPVLNSKQTNANGGLRMNLPIGTRFEASINTVKLETNSGFAFLNPQYNAFGSLSVRQPLLGGFFVSARKDLARTNSEEEAAKARYDQEVLAVTAQVEQSYWDLYAAERDYAVQKLTRDRAEAFFNETQTRARTGLIGPNQVATARTFRAEQVILLLDREELVDHLSDQLSTLTGKRPDAGKPRLITVDSPPENFPVDNVDQLIEQSLEKNLGVQAAAADVEAKRALAKAAFWEALPKVDFVGTLGGNGLTGMPRDVLFGGDTLRTTVSGTYGDAVSQALKRNFPTWSVGVEVSIPLGFRSGFGEEERLDAEVVIAEQRHVQAVRILEEQVRASYRDLANGTRRMEAAREGVEAAQEQFRIGLIQFQNGRSTAFELVRLGADFAVAQQRFTQALVRSAKAAANLRQLTSGAYTSSR